MAASLLGRIRQLSFPSLSPANRISAGLIALILSSILLLDLTVGLVPDRFATQLQTRKQVAETLAIHLTQLLKSTNRDDVVRTLTEIVVRQPEVLSVGIRDLDGRLYLFTGDHARHWVAPPTGQSTINHVRIPLRADGQHQFDVEVAFKPAHASALQRWLADPMLRVAIAIVISGLVLFSLYLRRAFVYLDPSAVIPGRVHAAFDTFTEGVMVLDPRGRVMLANKVLLGWLGETATGIQGRAAHQLPALAQGITVAPDDLPWMQAMQQRAPLTGTAMTFVVDDAAPRKTMANCAPIIDDPAMLRGCMVTFDDVSALDQANQALLDALDELNESRDQLEKQNQELHLLATRDPLTGCLNRRAFFEGVARLLKQEQAPDKPLHCIMSDIDHFKSFNDTHGHAIGDQVLQSVAKQLTQAMRNADLLCRYGGEEFCIILTGLTTEQASMVAERLRKKIESQAGAGVRSEVPLVVTSSFGLAVFTADIEDAAHLLKRADEALYQAKRSGRNRVVMWQESVAEA